MIEWKWDCWRNGWYGWKGATISRHGAWIHFVSVLTCHGARALCARARLHDHPLADGHGGSAVGVPSELRGDGLGGRLMVDCSESLAKCGGGEASAAAAEEASAGGADKIEAQRGNNRRDECH